MSKIIAISAGHGYNTAGKRCLKKLDAKETREWFLNDRIADKVEAELLNNYDCKVLRLDDTTGVKDIALSTRVKTANNAKADIYVSIHHNSGANGSKAGGTVVYHYNDNTSQAKALRLYNKVIAQTNLVGNRADKTVVGNHLYEIKKTSMVCTLLENGFMDSAIDVPIILSEEHAKKTATGIVNFLVAELNLAKKIVEVKPTVTQTVSKPVTSVPYVEYYPKCDKKYTTIYSALTSIGVNGSYSFRRKIAAKNNIGGLNGKAYIGSATQNTEMLNLLRAGLLKKA